MKRNVFPFPMKINDLTTVGSALKVVRAELVSITDESDLEASLILEEATGRNRSALLAFPEKELNLAEQEKILSLTSRRLEGSPLPYVLGKWEFYGNEFFVNPSVLIPRPETELMVDHAAAWLKQWKTGRMQEKLPDSGTLEGLSGNAVADIVGFGKDLRWPECADIGTGSGCIAVSLLKLFPALKFTACDISAAALETAQKNAELNGVEERINFLLSDLDEKLAGPLDLVCANLPYIPKERCRVLEVAKHEPLTALDGGRDGFDLYRRLFKGVREKMAAGGLILCELEYSQRNIALREASGSFPGAKIQIFNDLAGLPRLLEIQIKKL